MLKLYKCTDTAIHYWETWEENKKTAVIHWDLVGERGQDKEVKSSTPSGFREQIQQEIDQLLVDGYEPVELDEHHILLIEFAVNGMGITDDLVKRARSRYVGLAKTHAQHLFIATAMNLWRIVIPVTK